jgi:hypothetical protein
MPRLKPSDIGKSGRADFAGMSHLGLKETAWRLREAALAFDLDGNLANSWRPPDVDAPWSRQWRKKPVAPDGGATKRLPRRKAPNQLFLGWLASDGHGAYRDHPGRLRCLARLTRMAVALAGDVLAYSRKSICPIGE